MELAIVGIIIIVALMVLLFAEPSPKIDWEIKIPPYNPIEPPKYVHTEHKIEWVVPENMVKEVFVRDIKIGPKKKKTTTRENSKNRVDNNSDSNFHFDTVSVVPVDDNRKSSAPPCTPNYSSKSCGSPVESYSPSSSDSSSSSSCDSGGGSCGGD